MSERFRVGGKVPLNVYEDDRPMFQCHTPEDAARIVGLLNQSLDVFTRLRAELAESEKSLKSANEQLDAKPWLTSEEVGHMAAAYRERDELRVKYAESEKARKEADEARIDAEEHAVKFERQLTERDSRIAALNLDYELYRLSHPLSNDAIKELLDKIAALQHSHERLVEALQVISNLSSAKRNDIRAEGVLIEIRDRSNQALATPSAQQSAERIAAEKAKDAVIEAAQLVLENGYYDVDSDEFAVGSTLGVKLQKALAACDAALEKQK